ncbi:MAG: hypothetical protein EZS28_048569 [Streblomastix strix]|uniref:Uncharacterized protein n=1 Tax=Streblomastix strix TaxID=222440 RepID=A0A5J4TBX2_9EUKA|nr:MAG: hypothetical protein EZS28_048569 [Streblomastix strix]
MSLDDCSFAEEQQSGNDEKILERGSSSDCEEDDDDMNAMKNLVKTKNKRIVNNLAGGDSFFRSVSVVLCKYEDQFEYVREKACNYLETHKNENDFMHQFVSAEEAKIEKKRKRKMFIDTFRQKLKRTHFNILLGCVVLTNGQTVRFLKQLDERLGDKLTLCFQAVIVTVIILYNDFILTWDLLMVIIMLPL